MKTQYVLGFLFSAAPRYRYVVLIRKNKPEWQVGKLNGVGGKIERGEEPVDAMRREFLEECGVSKKNWIQYGKLVFPDAVVHLFAAEDGMLMHGVRSMTPEEVGVYYSEDTDEKRIPNLRFLIPMAQASLDAGPDALFNYFTLDYTRDDRRD